MIGPGLRRHPLVVQGYATAYAGLVRLGLRGRTGPRSFERVRIVAALGRQNGIATGAVLQWRALRSLGFDVDLVDATPAMRNPLFRAAHSPGTAYILHCGGPQTVCLLSAVLPHAAQAWRIAYWAWELPDPPRDWHGFDSFVSEVWTPSRFAQASLSRLTSRPIQVAPHAVPAQPPRLRERTAPFTVLAFADSRSSLARKNPVGAIDAFMQAFGNSPDARLIVKLNGPADETETLEQRAAAAPNVTVLRGFLSAEELAALYRTADVLLSLHRAEGFGLPMLEAMAHGVPVVATGWSGNLEFMDGRNGVLVPYSLVPVRDPAAIYGNSVWAEPEVAAAAAALHRLASDHEHYRQMAEAAYATVRSATPRLPLTGPLPAPVHERPASLARPDLRPGLAAIRSRGGGIGSDVHLTE